MVYLIFNAQLTYRQVEQITNIPKSPANTANSILARTKTDLLIDSDVIIRGVVKEILPSKLSYPNGSGGIKYDLSTDISIDIKEIFKGEPYDNSNIVIRESGRKNTFFNVSSLDFTDFTVGEEVLLFLEYVDKSKVDTYQNEKYYMLFGSSQAKYIFDKNEGDARIFKNVYEFEHKFNLSTIKDEIDQAIKNPKVYTQEEMNEYNRIMESGTKEEMDEANKNMWLYRYQKGP